MGASRTTQQTCPQGLRAKGSATPLALLALLGILHALVAFPNHALLRTYALDLGLYTHSLWHYAHGIMHDSSLFLEAPAPMLADHFDLYLILFSPLVYITGTWTLVVVQWLSLLVGAWGVYKVLREVGLPQGRAMNGMAILLLFFGVFGASAYDYHSSVVAAMMLPWFILNTIRNAPWRAALVFLFMVMGKENMGFWLGPLSLLLAGSAMVPLTMRRTLMILGSTGVVWSAVTVAWLMPWLAGAGTYAHFDYSLLGPGPLDAFTALWKKPLSLLSALFLDHMEVVDGSAIKLEFWVLMILSGGWALIVRPRWGLMALPLVAQKMWNDDPVKWSVIAQYSVEFAPLIAITMPLVLHDVPLQRKWTIALAVLVLVGCTIRFMDHTVAYQDRSRIRIYQAQHYTKPYDHRRVLALMDALPAHASISAQSPAVPHLALRDTLYQFPLVRNARYITLLPLESPYPLSRSDYDDRLRELNGSPEWEAIVNSEEVVLFKRR